MVSKLSDNLVANLLVCTVVVGLVVVVIAGCKSE